jgi:hypothetical protein
VANGKYDVILAKDKNILSNHNYASRQSKFMLAISDTKLQPIFTNDGAYETSLSPDESKLLLRYSYKK